MGIFDNLFKGVASAFDEPESEWFCDGCHAKLNNQAGFNVDSMTWECTECGHDNDVSSDNLYDSHEDYQRTMGIPSCPSCGGMVQGDAPDATYWFNCNRCSERWYLESGELISPFDRSRHPSGYSCSSCQRDLRGTLTSAWEDGNNESAYVQCESCGAKNYLEI